MTRSQTVPPTAWRPFFDRLSAALIGKRAEVEVASLELGDQVVAEWLPLLGITFDAQDDLLDVDLTGLNRLIRHPRQIQVQEGPHGLETIGVVTADGTTHVVRLKDPLMLPAPHARAI